MMKKPKIETGIALGAALLLAVGMSACSKEKKDGAGAASEPGGAAVLAKYEAVRAQLARDQMDGVAASAKELRAAAENVTGATGASKQGYTAIATAAAKLEKAGDIEAARLAFGEASKALIQVLAAEPKLAAGLHVFECPMAKGYRKWVQPTEKLQNPYMGQKMLACGGATKMQP